MRIAILGLGRMGRALASRLLAGGHEVVVWNRTPGKGGGLVDAGAKEAGSVADAVSGVDVAVTMLSDDTAVRQVALGHEGVLASLQSDAVYVDCSTVSPVLSADLEEAAGPDRFASVPVLGAPSAVESGQASYLAGGSPVLLGRIEPMLTSLSDKVRRYGRPQLATAAKLASNLLLLTEVVGLAEAFCVGRAGGLSDDQLRELLAESPMVPPGLKNRFEGVLTGEIDPWWTIALGAKDAGLAAAVARAAGMRVLVAEMVHDRYIEAVRNGLDGADISAVGRLYDLPEGRRPR